MTLTEVPYSKRFKFVLNQNRCLYPVMNLCSRTLTFPQHISESWSTIGCGFLIQSRCNLFSGDKWTFCLLSQCVQSYKVKRFRKWLPYM